MLRITFLALALALSTGSIGCIDDDSPEEKGPKKSGEDDPDLQQQPGDDDDDVPVPCPANLEQDDSDQPCTPPKP